MHATDHGPLPMKTASLDDYRWLIGPQAAAILTQLAADTAPLHQQTQRLRRHLTAARATLALEQVELRRRGAAKFPRAEEMFFTRTGLQQATDLWIAQYKAARMGRHGSVADLCCGLGGDLLALAGQKDALGVDRDPIAVLLAEANLSAARLKACVRCDPAEDADVAHFDAWHVDPDRRTEGHRTSRVASGSPSDEILEQLLTLNETAAVKLAPAAVVPKTWESRCQREWISRDRQCRQQVLWFGGTSTSHGQCRATAVHRDGRPADSIVGQPNVQISLANKIGPFVFEPDAAVLAAGLTGHLANGCGLQGLTAGVAYLTGDQLHQHGLLQAFEVVEVLPLDMKRLRAAIRERRIGNLEVKLRNLPHDPAVVRRQLRPAGDESATLLLTPTPQGARAILARRVPA